jgi:hypothetical protein
MLAGTTVKNAVAAELGTTNQTIAALDTHLTALDTHITALDTCLGDVEQGQIRMHNTLETVRSKVMSMDQTQRLVRPTV